MSSDLSIDSCDDSLSEFYLAPPLNYSDWNGRQITWRDVPEIRSEIERRILGIYYSGNHLLAHQLAALYFQQIHPRYETRPVKSSKGNIMTSGIPLDQYFKEINERTILKARKKLYETGLGKEPPPPLEPISPTNYPTLWAWQTYCLENGISLSTPKSHSGGFKEFWREHKKEIIIAAVIIAIAVTVAVVIVTTAGTGTNIAVATGAGAVQAALEGFGSFQDPNANVQNLQNDPQVSDAIQNFARTIGATSVDHENGIITTIETNTIASEVTPEFLTGLVTNWNENLIPVRLATATTGALPEIPCHPLIPQTTLQQLTTNERPPSPASNPLEQPSLQPSSPLPWVNEGISYLQWVEKNCQEQLFKELENKSKPSLSNDATPGQSALEVPPKVTNTNEWRGMPEEPRPRFNERIVEDYLNDIGRAPNGGTKNNYASKAARFFDGFQSPPPYQKMNLVGNRDQSTIHYHCGIGNSDSDINEGGTCLYETMSKDFAVQPHLIHSSSIRSGLGFVLLEQIEKNQAQVREIQQGFTFLEDDTLRWPKVILENSKIQSSIDYEVENLSKIAQNILSQGNPNLKQLHVTFSNGGYIFNEALKQMPLEYRDTIIVVTTGTTAIIDQDLAHKVYNIIGDKDKGSQLCNGGLSGIGRRKDKAEIEVIDQTETQKWIQGHYFMQPDYQKKISEYLEDEVISKYEIY